MSGFMKSLGGTLRHITEGPKVPGVQEVDKPPAKQDEDVQEARQKQVRQAQSRRGRASTRLTGGTGVQGEAPVAKKKLLGS